MELRGLAKIGKSAKIGFRVVCDTKTYDPKIAFPTVKV